MNAFELASSAQTAVYRLASASYPSVPPFHPASAYPEYRGNSLDPENGVYEGVRQLLYLLKLDRSHFGTPDWNPLGTLVLPGDKVLLKPNYLWHECQNRPDEWEQVITHGSVVRAVLDYVLLALQGKGEVWIADGPQYDADWTQIVKRTGIDQVCEFCQTTGSVPIRLLDLRQEQLDVRDGVTVRRTVLPGDPAGTTKIDLGSYSRLTGHGGSGRYYGSDYDQFETNQHHNNGRHEYLLARTATSADVFIDLPKMKTHKKVGVTLCLKNLVGINAGRNWLPHHTDGDPSNGGDQFLTPSLKGSLERWGLRNLQRMTMQQPGIFTPLFRLAKRVGRPTFGQTGETIRNGNWYGNDTAWRMVHDINRCLLYSDGDAEKLVHQKKTFAVVDGIVAGDGDGPSNPDRLDAGVLVGGSNFVAVDCVATRLMGFDPMRLSLLREAFAPHDLLLAPFAYTDIVIDSNYAPWRGHITDLQPTDCYRFRPHFGWRGHIEWETVAEPQGAA